MALIISEKFKRRVRREKYRRGGQRQTIGMITENEITEVIIGCAIKVHKQLLTRRFSEKTSRNSAFKKT